MKAVVVEQIGSFLIRDVPQPTVGPREVLVRVLVTGLCRTDLKIIRSGHRDLVLPRIPGEEVVGVVERTGAEVSRIRTGQRVYLYPGTSCGSCPACLSGAQNLCRSMQIMGFHRDGGFAEFVCTPEASIIPLPDGLPDEVAIFAEPLSCCLNGLERANLQAGDTVGIWGSGPAGMLVRRAAEAHGAHTWMVDPDARRREFSGAGATPHADGCDVAVVAVGNADAYQQAMKSLRPRGCLVFFSGLSPAAACQPVDLNTMHYLEQRTAGAYGCTYAQSEEAIRLLAEGQVHVGDLVSHRLSLCDLDQGLGIVERREGMKVLLFP
jgi:L-iditol 2-dehydrogenase